MIRLAALYLFCFVLAAYAWGDWYKSLCGLVLLVAIVEHPDMPKSMFGIPGLNPWNAVLLVILLAWAWSRRGEGLSWDMPPSMSILLLLYASVVLASFLRMMSDEGARQIDSTAGLVSEYLVNCFKWVVPGMLMFDGCRDRSRFRWALFSLLGVYLLLALQVIRWIPPGDAISGEALSARSLKILLNEVGFHRVNLSMMLAGASWACLAAAPLWPGGTVRMLLLGGVPALVYAQALTGGRMGYVTWAAVGLLLGALRWRKALLLIPAVLLFLLVAIPGVSERMMQGFSGDYDVPAVNSDPRAFDEEGPDIYTVTAGRTIAWGLVAEKIREAPAVGWGRQAMLRTGVARELLVRFGEEFGHPHNAYLEMLLDNGIVGFLAVVPFYFVVLRQGVSLFLDVRDPAFAAAGGVTLALVLALLVASMGSQTFYPREGAVPMWCAIGLMLRVHAERSRGSSLREEKAARPEEKPFWAPRP